MTRKIQILEKILNESQRDKIDKFKEGICSLFVSDPREDDIYSQALIELLVEYIAYVKIIDPIEVGKAIYALFITLPMKTMKAPKFIYGDEIVALHLSRY